MDDLEIALWQETPLYVLMCEVVNGERSDWPIGYGEPTHVEYMLGQEPDTSEGGGVTRHARDT